MKERYNKHEIAVIVLFVGILFAMLFGMAGAVCLPSSRHFPAGHREERCRK